MQAIILRSYAKINLTLDVLFKRPDGYHEIETLIQSISLCDRITLRAEGKNIKITCNSPKVPTNSRNLAYIAAEKLLKGAGISGGVEIEIEKNIPAAAGLGGGSSNAAAVLWGLNQLFQVNLNKAKLSQIAATIGADVSFFLYGGTCLAKGKGEIIERLHPLHEIWLLIVKPPFEISTPWVYRNLDLAQIKEHPKTNQVIEMLRQGDKKAIGKLLCNVLETVVLRWHPEIELIKKQLQDSGALGALMSGSGPAVFGLMPNESVAREAYERLKASFSEVFLCQTTAKGVEIENGKNCWERASLKERRKASRLSSLP